MGSGALPVIQRLDDAKPVAFLVAISGWRGTVAIPLRAGLDFLGREEGLAMHAWPSGGVLVEAAQWFFRCDDRGALVSDAASSGYSTLQRGDRCARLPHPRWHPEFLQRMHAEGYLDARGEGTFPQDMQIRADGLMLDWQPISEGDLLDCDCGTFAFGWC